MTAVAVGTRQIKSSRGVVLHVRGDGPAVVMLHGIGGSAASCAPLAELLAAAGFKTYAWDAPGYGASADPVGDLDPAGEVITLLEELSLGPVTIFGTSWGGVIAMDLAVRRPDLVSALVVADSTRGSGTSPQKATAMRARVTELAEQGGRVVAAHRSKRLVSPSTGAETLATVEAVMAQIRVPGYAAAADYMAAGDLGPVLGEVGVPTLVVVGADDIVTGLPESELLAREIPGARLVVIDDAGHAALTERPDAMADAVLTFLQEVAR